MRYFAFILFVSCFLYAEGALLYEKTTLIYKDSLKIERMEGKLKFLTRRAISRFGNKRFKFDDREDSVHVNYARVTRGGDTLNLPVSAINIVGDREASAYPAFSSRKVLELAFIGLEPGATAEYSVDIISKRKKKFSGIHYFRRNGLDVREATFEVILNGDSLRFKKAGNLDVNVKRFGNEYHYVFKAENLRRIPDEYGEPPLHQLSPFVVYSTYKNWLEFENELRESYFDEKIIDLSEIRNVEELFKKYSLMDLERDYAGLLPIDIDRGLKTGFVTAPERAYLLLKFKKEGELLFIFAPYIKPDTILPGDYLIEKVLFKDGEEIIDPSFTYGTLDYVSPTGRWALSIGKNGGKFIYIEPLKMDTLRVNLKLDLNTKNGEIFIYTRGVFDSRLKEYLIQLTEMERKRYFREFLSLLGGYVLSNYKLSNLRSVSLPLEIHINFRFEPHIVKEKDIGIFTLPFPLKKWPLTFYRVIKERESPLYMDEFRRYECNYEIEGIDIIAHPEAKKIKTKFGKFERKTHKEEGKLYVNCSIELEKGTYRTDEMDRYSDFLYNFLDDENRLLILHPSSEWRNY